MNIKIHLSGKYPGGHEDKYRSLCGDYGYDENFITVRANERNLPKVTCRYCLNAYKRELARPIHIHRNNSPNGCTTFCGLWGDTIYKQVGEKLYKQATCKSCRRLFDVIRLKKGRFQNPLFPKPVNVKRIVLAKGNHWFYNKEALKGNKSSGWYNLVGILDRNRNLITFGDNIPESQKVRLVLEIDQ